jgi:hypothetical protein
MRLRVDLVLDIVLGAASCVGHIRKKLEKIQVLKNQLRTYKIHLTRQQPLLSLLGF